LWKFDRQTYEVPADKDITIEFNSAEGLHGIKIDGTNVNLKENGTVKLNLKPGTYNIYCSLLCGPGHGKMSATLVVS
jgi:heme/copper-type cytochrome/quinol oxidase subunit 2